MLEKNVLSVSKPIFSCNRMLTECTNLCDIGKKQAGLLFDYILVYLITKRIN
jgi:hypothetical protein